MLDIAFEGILLLKDLIAYFKKAALKRDLLLQRIWHVRKESFIAYF